MSTNPTPPVEETGETHSQRRRSARRRVPKIEWEESTSNNRDEDRDNNEGGPNDVSKVKKLSKGPSRDKRKSRSIMEGNRVNKGRDSKGVRASVEGKTGFTIPSSIFNDIPDIDLCPLENTRKRHSKQASLSPHKMRKLMKHSDGCSSNSPGSETSSTDGMESRLNDSNVPQHNDIAESAIGSPEIPLQNQSILCSTCPVSDSKPTQLETRAIEQPVSSHEVLSFIDHSTSAKSWSKEDVNPNSTSPVILWAVDNIPDALNTDSSEEEWMNIIDVVLSLWNAQPHSTKLNYLDKANKNRCSKGLLPYEDSGVVQDAVATTNISSINNGIVTGSTEQADNHSKINNINPSSRLPLSPPSSSTSLSKGGTMTLLHQSSHSPLSMVTPCQSQPIPPSNGALFSNLPLPLLAATSLMIDQNMWQPTSTAAVDPSSSSAGATPLSSWSTPSGSTVVPYCFPTSLSINLPTFTSSENSTVSVPSFGNALKLSASIPVTMADHINKTSTNSSLNKSALPIVQVENPVAVCSSPSSQLDFPLPLHNIAGPFQSFPGPFLSTPFSITPFDMSGTPHYSLSQTTTHDDITTPTSILTNQASLQSNFCINSILGGVTSVTPLSVGNKPTPTIVSILGSQQSSTKPVKKRKDKKSLSSSNSSKDNAMKRSPQCSTVAPSEPSNTVTTTSAIPTIVSTVMTGLSQTPSVNTTEGLSCSSSNYKSFTAVSEEWKRSLEKQVREKNSAKRKTSRNNKVTKSGKPGSSQNVLVTIEGPKKAKFQKKRNMTSPLTTPIPSRLNSPLVFDQSFGCSPPQVFPPWHSSLQLSSPSHSLTPLSSPQYSNPLLSPSHPCSSLLKGSGTLTSSVPASPSTTPSPALFSNSPALLSNSPALLSNSPVLFANSPALFTPSTDGSLKGVKISAEDQIKFDALNYANLERHYWNMLLVLEEQKQSIANIKERLVKARMEQQTMMLNNEKFNHMKELVVNPVLDPVVPDLLTETYKELPLTSEIKLKGTFDRPILENEDIYKYLLQNH